MSASSKISSLIISLYLPWALACALGSSPVTSFLVAWLGSFFIFYQTWFSSKRSIFTDLPAYRQIMRPIFLQQLIFAGFMCCTSIFFFINTLGYRYFEKTNNTNSPVLNETLASIAQCQRLSLLAHAALVTGILLKQKNHKTSAIFFKPLSRVSKENWLIRVGVISFIVSLAMQRMPGIFQFSIGLYNVAFICGALILVKGVTQNNLVLMAWGGTIFVINFLNASLSGYKEPIIVNCILLGCLFYPYYKKAVTGMAIPFFLLLFYIAPSYSGVVRSQSWNGEASAEEARAEALENIFREEEISLEETNWSFLTDRFSEIGMFTLYVKNTPEQIPYYNLEIIKNAVTVLVPRALWVDKPITEELAMQRVYAAGVVDSRSRVSAKTRPVVDGYLSFGGIGVFIYMLLLGIVSQSLNNKAERLFGGYEIGCIIIFNGFFQILWRGETTEFLVNSVFWGFVAMMAFWAALRFFNFLEKVQ